MTMRGYLMTKATEQEQKREMNKQAVFFPAVCITQTLSILILFLVWLYR